MQQGNGEDAVGVGIGEGGSRSDQSEVLEQPQLGFRRDPAKHKDRRRDGDDRERDGGCLVRRASDDGATGDDSGALVGPGTVRALLAHGRVVRALHADRLVARRTRQARRPVRMPVAGGRGGFFHYVEGNDDERKAVPVARISDLGSRNSDLGLRVSDFGLRLSPLGTSSLFNSLSVFLVPSDWLNMHLRPAYFAVAAAVLVLAACSSGDEVSDSSSTTTAASEAQSSTTTRPEGEVIAPAEKSGLRNQASYEFPAAPSVPDVPITPSLEESLDALYRGLLAGLAQEPQIVTLDIPVIEEIGASGDARSAWVLSDLLGVLGDPAIRDALTDAFELLTGATIADDPVSERSVGQSVADHLIAWDLPEPTGYIDWKAELLLLIDPRWEPFFDDRESDIDWRWVGWGGVRIDDRPLGDPFGCPRGCIPALDDPGVTDASGGDWYADERLIFGVTVNGESRAYPKHIMETQEMVNDTLGGRRLGIPYCTLCGSAQAYFTDSVPDGVEVPVLRTSGLLSRSNKVMFDLNTFSVMDTFNGTALSGPLRDAGIVLDQTSVVVSSWGDWKEAHPDTTIVARDGGIGRAYRLDPLGDRDADGAIFPIGDVDERLPTQEQVLGVVAQDGTPIAFPVAAARDALENGEMVSFLGVELQADGSGLRAFAADGSEVVGHQSFWFAWSQFNPETVVWKAP